MTKIIYTENLTLPNGPIAVAIEELNLAHAEWRMTVLDGDQPICWVDLELGSA